MLPTSHRQVLELLLTRLAAQGILWTLTGSTSFALQGMPLTPNDIDVQTDRYGVYVIADLFEADIIRPPFLYTTSWARSYFLVLAIEGVAVEVMGDMQHANDVGGYDDPPDLTAHRRFVDLGGMAIPVLAFEYEIDAYRRMGRESRAQQLSDWLLQSKSVGCRS